MSFREERLCALACPLAVSLDTFRLPNFALMERLMRWLLQCYDPNADLPPVSDDQESRVYFVRSAVLILATKAQIKINSRRLYQADGYAVRELLKVASLLYEADIAAAAAITEHQQPNTSSHERISQSPTRSVPLDMPAKLSQVKAARDLASDITELGAHLYELLERELECKEYRYQAIARPVDLPIMERTVRQLQQQLSEQIVATQTALENLKGDTGNLSSKIDKKRLEFERREKRLKSLQGVRPAYMDEFERLEVDLTKLYQIYVEKHRNLSYLEQQLDEVRVIEHGKAEETEQTLRRMQERLKQEELDMLGMRDDEDMGLDTIEATGSMHFPLGSNNRDVDGRGRRGITNGNVMGGDEEDDDDNNDDMNEEGDDDDDDDEEDMSTKNDDDLDDNEVGDDDDEDDDVDMERLIGEVRGRGLYTDRNNNGNEDETSLNLRSETDEEDTSDTDQRFSRRGGVLHEDRRVARRKPQSDLSGSQQQMGRPKAAGLSRSLLTSHNGLTGQPSDDQDSGFGGGGRDLQDEEPDDEELGDEDAEFGVGGEDGTEDGQEENTEDGQEEHSDNDF